MALIVTRAQNMAEALNFTAASIEYIHYNYSLLGEIETTNTESRLFNVMFQ